mgnify:CR=1 FL=1
MITFSRYGYIDSDEIVKQKYLISNTVVGCLNGREHTR